MGFFDGINSALGDFGRSTGLDKVGENLFGTQTAQDASNNLNAAATNSQEVNDRAQALAKTMTEVGKNADDISNTYGQTAKDAKVTGDNAGKTSVEAAKAREAAGLTGKTAEDIGSQGKSDTNIARNLGAGYDAGTRQSMGANANEYMQNAQKSAESGAEQAGQVAATKGTQAALRGARSSGLSKGQAALAAGQQAGDIYGNTYQTGLESGKNAYMTGTQQIAGQGSEMANRVNQGMANQQGAVGLEQSAIDKQNAATGLQQNAVGLQQSAVGLQQGAASGQLGAQNTKLGMYGQQNNALNTQLGATGNQANIANSQATNANNKASGTWGTIGTLAGAGVQALKLSDKRAKFNVEDAKKTLDIMKIAKVVKPVSFEYKKEIVSKGKGGPGEHVGVMAQDLEKTPLASAVLTGEDGLKRIDNNQLSPTLLLDLVIQLAQRLNTLEGKK